MLTTIKTDIKAAMRNKDTLRKNILRLVLSKANEISKKDGDRDTTDQDMLTVIQKQIKQNNEVITIAKDNDRDFSNDQLEVEILSSYLPKQLDEKALAELVGGIVNNIPVEELSPKSLGNIMGALSAHKNFIDMGQARQLAMKLINQ